MDSIEKLVEYYNKSNEQNVYRDVVEQILVNLHKVKKSTIYDLAELCYSSPSTISRLVKKLEFKDYADFKSKITYSLENYRYLNRNTREIELQEDRDSVDLYFNFLQNNINALHDRIEYEDIRRISDYFYQADKGTVILAIIPDLLEMSPMRSILKKAKERGAIIITLCSGKRNDYARCSDVQISFDGTKTSMDLYLFMILVNIIQYDYGNRYLDHIIEDMYDE